MILIISVAVLVGILIFVFALLEGDKKTPRDQTKGSIAFPYTKKEYFFTRSERALYSQLKNNVLPSYEVFSKVRLADLLVIKAQGSEYFKAFGRISQKHVDFVICDQEYRPLLVIELDGDSHSRSKQKKADETKDQALQAAGLPILRLKVSEKWDINAINAALLRR